MRRRLLITAALALWLSIAAPAGAKQDAPRPVCDRLPDTRCERLAVPLDRRGTVPGTVFLNVQRSSVRRSGSPLIAVQGGPGQASVGSFELIADLFRDALKNRELVVFDSRGTGRSGLLRCPGLEDETDLGSYDEQAQECASRLGATRGLYTTEQSVQDIEALRVRLGRERISLYGVSYGSKVALAYALSFPGRVDRLILDSPVELDGPDAFVMDTIGAARRVLRAVCGSRCRSFTADPGADLEALGARLRTSPLRGFSYDSRGRRRAGALSGADLILLMTFGDFDPEFRARLPAAIRSGAAGDAAPLLRLARRVEASAAEAEPPSSFSSALFVATLCEEAVVPWSRGLPLEQRDDAIRARAAALGEPAFGFAGSSAAIAVSDILALCRGWPEAAPAPAPLPATAVGTRTLVLSGEDDLRTPFESARRLTARLGPAAALLRIPQAGHAVLATDRSPCAGRAVIAFLNGRTPVTRCRDVPPGPAPAGPAPKRLEDLAPLGGSGGRAGRTLAAVAATLDDVEEELNAIIVSREGLGQSTGVLAGGGLRGGSFRADARTVALRSVSLVDDVRVTGVLRDGLQLTGTMRVTGSAASGGTLRLDSRRLLSGRLGGRAVRYRRPFKAARGRAAARAGSGGSARRDRLRRFRGHIGR